MCIQEVLPVVINAVEPVLELSSTTGGEEAALVPNTASSSS